MTSRTPNDTGSPGGGTPPISRPASYITLPTTMRPYSNVLSPQAEDPGTERTPLLPGSAEGSILTTGSTLKSKQSESSPTTRSPWKKLATRSKYYIPGLDWIPRYDFTSFWGDFLGGVSVASVLIPQSMSYATSLAHLDASTGLFAAAIPGIMYAIFGTCRHLNVGPEAALSLLVGQAISEIVKGDPHGSKAAIAVSTIITFQVGLISFLLGLFRLGFIDVVLSRALLRGFITAVAVVIMIEQLIPMLGLEDLVHSIEPSPHSTLEKFMFLVRNAFVNGKALTSMISFGSLFILVAVRNIKRLVAGSGVKYITWVKYIPEIFLVVVVSTILSDIYDWADKGVTILGSVTVDTGTFFDVPIRHHTTKYLKKTTSTATLIAVAGFLDSIAAAKQNSARFGYSISPNRELVALGAGNLVSSFFPGTLPAYGSITRSRINADSGVQTQTASLICSTLVILAVIFLLPALKYLPKAVLAAIIGLVVNSILAEAPHDIGYFWKMSAWTDLGLMALTFFVTIVWNVEVGIIVSVTVSLLLIVRRSSQTNIKILGRVPGTHRWRPISENPEDVEEVPGVLIVRLRDNLDFANTGQIKDRLRRLELYGPKKTHPSEAASREDARAVVFHMADVDAMDASAAQIFGELTATYKGRNVQVHFAHLQPQQWETFRKADIVPKIVPEERIHENVASAMEAIEQDRPVWDGSV